MDPGAGGGLASEAMPTRFWVRSRGRSGRRGQVMPALCGFLDVGLPLSTAHAQSPAAPAAPQPSPAPPAPPARPPVPADPWTSPDGSVPPPAYGSDAYGAPQPGYPGTPAGGLIQIDITAAEPGVRLDRVQGAGLSTPECVAPCSKLVPRNNLNVIDGEGSRCTSQFLLPDVRIQVTRDGMAGASARHGGGAARLGAGLVVG